MKPSGFENNRTADRVGEEKQISYYDAEEFAAKMRSMTGGFYDRTVHVFYETDYTRGHPVKFTHQLVNPQ